MLHFEDEGTEMKTCLGLSTGVGVGLRLGFIIPLQTTLVTARQKLSQGAD